MFQAEEEKCEGPEACGCLAASRETMAEAETGKGTDW